MSAAVRLLEKGMCLVFWQEGKDIVQQAAACCLDVGCKIAVRIGRLREVLAS